MSTDKIRAAILGASGYTGSELVRLLSKHPNVDIVLLTADRNAGQPLSAVFPHLGGLELPGLISLDQVEWGGLDVDVVFCALPHGTTQEIVKGLLHATGHTLIDELIVERTEDMIAEIPKSVKVVDLSADFRLDDAGVYEEWYGHEHYAPKLQPIAVYGLSEFSREEIKKADLVACPGCYPTSALLPLVPLLETGQIQAADIIIDAKSGVTGAGRSAKEANLFAEVASGVHAYGLAGHRHRPEMEQELSRVANGPVAVSFTPHLMPMNRGILSTIYVKLSDGVTADDLRASLVQRYQDEPFVRVLGAGEAPATRHVSGSNHALIAVAADHQPGRAVLICAIDNLVKGASGQAVQNMNLMFGFDETAGLEQEALFP